MAVIVRVELTLLRALERSCCLYNVQFHYHYKKNGDPIEIRTRATHVSSGSTNRYTIGPMAEIEGLEPSTRIIRHRLAVCSFTINVYLQGLPN